MKKIFLVLVSLFILMSQLAWQEAPFEEITPKARESIAKGLKWLIDNQNNDGSWGCEKNQPPSVALTSMAILALMSSGSTPDRGLYSKQIKKAIDWLDANITRSGFLSAFDSTGMGETFEHACGVLALSQIYGMTKYKENEKIKGYLKQGLEILEKLQNKDGGWSGHVIQGSGSEIGVTCMTYLAIRVGYASGLSHDRADLKKMEDFVKRWGQNARSQIYALSAYLRIMYGLGRSSKDQDKFTENLLKMKLGQEGNKMSEWDYLAAFYSVGALIHIDTSESWKKWFVYVRDFLIKIQHPQGYWIVEYCLHCKVFATSLALISLSMPTRILPIYQY